MPNEEDFVDKLEQSILDIQAKCNYFVPQFIIDDWSKNESSKQVDQTADFKEHTDNNISIFFDDDGNDGDNDDDDDDDYNNGSSGKKNEKYLKQPISKFKGKKDSKKDSNESTYLLKNRDHIQINIEEADLDDPEHILENKPDENTVKPNQENISTI